MSQSVPESILRFEDLQIDPTEFDHRAHLEVAFDMLAVYDFTEAVSRYALTLKALTAKLGVPEKYNATVTFALMSIIAERRDATKSELFSDFISVNSDLLKGNPLLSLYSQARLSSEVARRVFVLPDLN